MSFADSFFTSFDGFLHGLNDWFGKSAESLCRLETINDDYILVADDGSLITVLELHGSMNMVGTEEFNPVLERVLNELNAKMQKGGHAIQFVMHYDPDEAMYEVEGLMASARATAQNVGFSVQEMFDEWRDRIVDYCASEHVWVVLWTRPFLLPPATLKEARKRQGAVISKSPIASGKQVVERGLQAIADDHRAFVEGLASAFRDVNILAERIEVHRLLWFIRRNIDRGYTGRGWRACLPGDPLPKLMPDSGEKDFAGFLYPSIGAQLYPREIQNVTGNILRVGDSWHGSLIMTLPPQNVKPFNVLFRSLIKAKVPWRAGFLLEGDGLTSLTFKSIVATILHFTSTTNKKFNQAVDQLRELDMSGEAITRFRATFGTSLHGETDEKRAVAIITERLSLISSFVQSWGSADVRDVIGDPLLGLNATLPALMPVSPAPTAAAPLADALTMMPLVRPASVWREGNVIFRTPDGKLMPYQHNSTRQAAWVDLGVAPMGGGKSVMLNTLNFTFCFQEGLTRLPWLSIIDVGPSSSGLIELVKTGLPESKRYLAQYHRLRMDPDYSINPFDTPLGVRTPLPSHKAFLVNLMTLLATELTAEAPQDGIPGIARASIDAVYDELSPARNPRIYTRFSDDIVDAVLDSLSNKIRIDSKTSWWEVTDTLFQEGYIHEAVRAQRFAVPLLADVAAMAKREMVKGVYKHMTPGQEPITDFFWRSCIDAINAYPILKAPTRFDIGDAQIVSLDLDEVAPRGGAEADRQTAVMYMLARHVVGSRFFLMPADLKFIPDLYKDYHRQRIDFVRQDPKRLCYDETHRVMRNSSVSKQLVGDIETISRESRKWNLSLGLYSQSIDDYPDIIIELATSIYILGVGTIKMAEYLQRRFGLSNAAFTAMQRLGKPGKAGANFIAIYKTGQGQSVHFLTNTIGGQALWAFSTTTEDVTIRNRLYLIIGVQDTLKILAKKYPGGVKEEVERRKQLKSVSAFDEENEDVISEMIEEIIAGRNKGH